MDDDIPSAFYTGLVAEMYGALKSESPDPSIYERFILRAGQPALELGCGDGEPLLALLARGLDVEGLDSSLDMLDRCRTAAAERQLEVVLHHATFEEMNLGRRYRSIYLAGATFNLLPDDASAQLALGRIAAHLEPGGSALIPLFIPEFNPSVVGTSSAYQTADGATMTLTVLAVDRDLGRRVQTTRFRYETTNAGQNRTVERTWLLHWIEQAQFAQMAHEAGLIVKAVSAPDGSRAGPDDHSFSFVLRRRALGSERAGSQRNG
jgi:ubiquinone/menaquinone biosynthesis C-methylase UbiE